MTTNTTSVKIFSILGCELKEDTVDAGFVMAGDDILKVLIIRYVFNEIDIFGVYQQDRRLLVFPEIGEVFLLDVSEVTGGDVALKVSAASGDLPQQAVGGGVEVEDQVGFGQGTRDGIENGAEERKLVGGEVVLGEKQAFVDEIVADDEVGEEVAGGDQRLELLVAVHQERHLHGEGVMLRILVELLEEGVVGESLQHELRVEVAGKHRGKRGLPCADAAFHDDIIVRYFHGEQ